MIVYIILFNIRSIETACESMEAFLNMMSGCGNMFDSRNMEQKYESGATKFLVRILATDGLLLFIWGPFTNML